MTAITAARLVSLSLAAGALAACGGSAPTAPPPPQTGSNNSTPQLREVSILAPPSSVQIGKTETLRAVATYSDGGFVDVTKEAVWSSSQEACRASSGGAVTGVSAGVAEIVATVGNVTSAPARVACGFVITITTHENFPTEDVTVPGVQGLVLDGPLAGYSFITDAGGRAVLPPVAAAGFGLHFKKPGFENYGHRVAELPREISIGIPMVPEFGQTLDLQGGCTSAPSTFVRRFTMPRTGQIRFYAEFTQISRTAPFAFLTVSVRLAEGGSGVFAFANEAAPGPARSDVKEFRAQPTEYIVDVRTGGCEPSDRWRVFVEYSR